MGRLMDVRVIDVLRSLAFYVIFYVGSVPYILFAVLVLRMGRDTLGAVATAWARYHRFCVRFLLGIRVTVVGAVPPGPVLVAYKHESFFEAIDTPALIPGLTAFAKAELFRIPLWGLAAKTYGLVPVERDQGAKSLRAMIAAAKLEAAAGRVLLIFPEGTRVPHGTIAPLQAGFAGIYKMLALPVVPIAVDSGPLYHRRWKRSGVVHVQIGEAIPPGLAREAIEARVIAAINVLNSADPLQGYTPDE
jgi:1-acyl-sn-glycerol-3-phosphate acyltransferase